MRLASRLRPLIPIAFFGFAGLAYLDPGLFAVAHARAREGALWMTLSFLAAGCAAKMTLPLSLFGWQARISAPLFLLLATPYFLRFLIWREVARGLSAWLFTAPPDPPPAPAKSTPYALPARVAVALQAAARARR